MKTFLLKMVDSLNAYSVFNRYTRNTATIFMMHSISNEESQKNEDITPSRLRYYFEYLRKNDYQVVSLTHYIEEILNNKNTFKQVVFTVDDGYRDFYLNAYKIFRDYQYPATIFVTSDFIQNKLFMWWDKIRYSILSTEKRIVTIPEIGLGHLEIDTNYKKKKIIQIITQKCKEMENQKKLKFIDLLTERLNVDISGQPSGPYEPLGWKEISEMNNNGIEFHPHTKTHPIMARIPKKQIREELKEPKDILEKKLGIKANVFCYPNGGLNDFNETTIAELKDCGYIAAVTGVPGFANTKKTNDMFRINRFNLPVIAMYFKQYVSGMERLKFLILKGYRHNKIKY